MSVEQNSNYDLSKLADSDDPEFLHNLRVAYLNITQNQMKEYFKILGNHFTHKLHTKQGNEILAAITAVMPFERAGEIFEESGIINFLPFGLKQFSEKLLDLLFFVANKCPSVFDDSQVVAKLSQFCESFPRKVLTIIAFYGQQWSTVKNPMTMLDILFHKSESFRNAECAEDYVSLMIWLLRNYEEFKNQRLQHCWSYLCDMLTSTAPLVINVTYNGLCAAFEINPGLIQTFGYPSEAIACHIQHKSTQQATLSLLLRYPPLPNAKYIDQIIISLTELAEKDERATLLLLELATDESISDILIQHPSWMCKGIPRILDTLRLFGIVILHNELRQKVIETHETVGFFMSLLQVNSVGVCNAVCTIMKKLSPTPEFITLLSSSGFLAGYFGVSLEMNDPSVRLSALRLLDTLSRVKFVPEFMDMIPLVVDLCKNGGDLALPAAVVAVKLARYPKCAKEMRSKRLDEFFQQPLNDPRIKKYGNKFLSILSHIEVA